MTIDNATQIEFWNGETGRNWVTHDALMEAMLQPLGESVMDALAPQPGDCLLYTSPSPRDISGSRMPSSA